MKERSKSHANINKCKHKQQLVVEPYLHFPVNRTIQKYIESKQIELKEHNNNNHNNSNSNKQSMQIKKEREFNLTMKGNKMQQHHYCYHTPMNKQHNELIQLKEDNVKLKEMLIMYKQQYEQLFQTFNSLKKEIDLFALSSQLKVKQKPKRQINNNNNSNNVNACSIKAKKQFISNDDEMLPNNNNNMVKTNSNYNTTINGLSFSDEDEILN